jgi:cytochrome c556
MKTEIKTDKKFDAVKYMRQERDRMSKMIKGMTPEQEIEYFRKKSEEFRKSK